MYAVVIAEVGGGANDAYPIDGAHGGGGRDLFIDIPEKRLFEDGRDC